jgi:hypothetical protein
MNKITSLFSKVVLSLSLAIPLVLGASQTGDYFSSISHDQLISAAAKVGKDKGRGQREGGGKYRRADKQKEMVGIDRPKTTKNG